MKTANGKNRGVRANCSYCEYGGEVKDFMCNCSSPKLKITYKRSVGYRKCQEFSLDDSKYSNYA